MNSKSSNYFEYKKNKIQSTAMVEEKPISKLNFIFQLFIATFIIMFIVIVIFIMKYSAKMDIEYTKGDLSFHNADNMNNISGYSNILDDEPRKIDKRLALIQQEENAPVESKVVANEIDDNSNENVMDLENYNNEKEIQKEKKIIEEPKEQKQKKQQDSVTMTSVLEEVKTPSKKKAEPEINLQEPISVVVSKVLIGRYQTFEDAQKMQNLIKTKDPKATPFIRKIGDVYGIQMGSYLDFNVAKTQAQLLKAKGWDVWIYQQ